MGYPIGQEELGSVLQKALDSIPEERRQLFAAKATFDAVLTDAQRGWLESAPPVRVVYDPGWAPLEYRGDDGAVAGFAAHYMGAINQLSGLEFEQVDTETWAGSLEAIREGRADVAFTLAETPERSEYMGFTDPYVTVEWNVVTADPSAIAMGTIEGYAIESWLDANGFEYAQYPDHAAALEALSSGEIDALLDTFAVVQNSADADLLNAGEIGDGLELSVGYASGQAELGGILRAAMDAIPDRIHDSIYSAVSGGSEYSVQMSASSRAFNAALTDAQRGWLESAPPVRVVYDPGWAPLEYRGDDGAVAGFAAHYMGAINQLSGLEFEQVDTETWAGSLEAIREGRADVAFTLAETPERSEYMGFTDPYVTVEWNVVTADPSAIAMGTIEGYAIESWLDANGFEYAQYPDHAAALEALSSGEIDALLDTFAVVQNSADADLLNAGEIGDGLELSVGYASGQAELGGILRAAMDAIPDGMHMSIYDAVSGR